MEVRKHRSMINVQELRFIERAVKCRFYELTPYCIERLITRGITNQEVMRAIFEGEVVEIHFKGATVRVLMRGEANKKNQDTCVVVDLATNLIITAYQNHTRDRHHNLQTELYDDSLDIFSLMREQLDKKVANKN